MAAPGSPLHWPALRRRPAVDREAAAETRARRLWRLAVATLLVAVALGVAHPGYHWLAVEAPGALEPLVVVFALLGLGALVYFVASVTALVIEGDLHYLLKRRPMPARHGQLDNHVIVCGVGRSGAHVVRELVAFGVDVVFVEVDPSRAAGLVDELGDGALHVPGDALSDAILLRAGVEHARGLVATLPSDRDNLYLCVNARQLNPGLRVVAKSDERSSAAKFESIGVKRVVSPASLGGRRLAAELLRPQAAPPEAHGDDLSLLEVPIVEGAPRADCTLHEAALQRDSGCVVVGLRGPGEAAYRYHPPPTARLVVGGSVIAVGHRDQHERLVPLLTGEGD